MAGDLNQEVAATAVKDLREDQPARGTLLLCSSPVGQISMGPPNAERTLFTGAVLEVLQQGIEGGQPYLSFADLRDAAFERMLASFGANAPRPALHQVNATQGDLTRAPAFLNRAGVENLGKENEASAIPATEPLLPPQVQLLQVLNKPEVSPLRLSEAKALIRKASKFSALGQSDEEITVYHELVTRFGSAHDGEQREHVAKALYKMGLTFSDLGRSEEGNCRLRRPDCPLRKCQRIATSKQVAKALYAKGFLLGSSKEAIGAYHDLIARFGGAWELPLRELVGRALYGKGFALGDSEEAVSVYDELIAHFGSARELPLRELVARALFNKGVTLGALGRKAEAIDAYQDLISRFGSANDGPLRELVAKALFSKGFFARRQRRGDLHLR